MQITLKKHAIKIAIAMFVITLAMFYVNYVIIFQAPLTPTNHFGFFLYSFGFALITFIYAHFRLTVGFTVFFFGWLFTLVQLYIDLLKARIETGGTAGAALGFIFNMAFVLIISIVAEGLRQLIKLFVKTMSKTDAK